MNDFNKNNEVEKIIREKIDNLMKKKGYVAGVGKEKRGIWSFPLLHKETGELVFWASASELGLQVEFFNLVLNKAS